MWWAVLLSWWLLGSLAYSCPQHCRCFTDDDGYKVANCSKSGLLSGDVSPTIHTLNFKNQLRGSRTKLEARIFRNFRGIHYLNLQNSSISHLPIDVFDGLARVTRIDLSFNKIKHLNGVVFSRLPSLKYLSVRGNFLSLSPFDVIVSETLQELDMGLCSIVSIPLHTFDSAPNIRFLSLDGNFIQTLEYNVLPKGLNSLNLANNYIVKPPINVFNSLRHLSRLDISNNPINCSCSLLVFQDSLSGRAVILENDVVCANPPHLAGKRINEVNENQLCIDDYMKRGGISMIPPRSKKNHHPKHADPQVQSDEPLMMDESYGDRDAEVMFTNDETNQMGTHMENRGIQAYENTKVGDTMDGTTGATISEDLVEKHSTTTTAELNEFTVENGISKSDVDDVVSDSDSEKLTSDVPKTEDTSEISHSDDYDDDRHTTVPNNDVEILHERSSDQEFSNLESADEGTTTEVSLISKTPSEYTLPTSATEPSDYSYDSQHADYGAADNATSSETSEDDAQQTVSSSTPQQELEHYEGSGDPIDEATDMNIASSTIGFMEERERGTEAPLRTVSDDLGDFSTSTSSNDFPEMVTTEATFSSSSEEPSTTVEGPVTGWEIESSSDSSSTETITEINFENSSLSSTTDFVDLGGFTGVSSSTKSSDYDMTTEDENSSLSWSTDFVDLGGFTDVSSSTKSSYYDMTTEDVTPEVSTEPVTDLPSLPEVSSEPPTTESTELPLLESWPSSSSEPTSSSREPGWWESGEVEVSPSSSTASPDELSSTLSQVYKKKPKMLESTTEPSVTPEVDVFKVSVDGSDKESIRDDPSRIEKANILTTGTTFIIIGVLIALILILMTVIVCKKRKSSKKIRLPADPEAGAGTELQDMLLPKPPENGIKVVPKNYTNGTTPISNGKKKEPEDDAEESVPALGPEPETDDHEPEDRWEDKPEPKDRWEDKPEPIEAVTARLTILARPQTPIFIQKSLT